MKELAELQQVQKKKTFEKKLTMVFLLPRLIVTREISRLIQILFGLCDIKYVFVETQDARDRFLLVYQISNE